MLLLRGTYNIHYEWKGPSWVQRWENLKTKVRAIVTYIILWGTMTVTYQFITAHRIKHSVVMIMFCIQPIQSIGNSEQPVFWAVTRELTQLFLPNGPIRFHVFLVIYKASYFLHLQLLLHSHTEK